MKVTSTIVEQAKVDVPYGRTAAGYQYTLTKGDNNATLTTTEPVAVFNDVSPGDYIVSVCRLLDDGSVLGPPATASISIPAPVQADVPVTITVSLSA